MAVIANASIATAKIIAALFTGSASMWAEAAHSVADSGNELLLFVGLRRSKKQADERHPFGYGQERFFWAFLAALGIFLVGGALSIGEGIRSLLLPEPLDSWLVGVGVLLVAAVFEGYSWTVARRQLRAGARARERSMSEHLRRASDPSATTVFLEDSAALIGLGIALVALLLHELTGWAQWDAIGSMGIGVLLIVVAYLLARRSKALLLDESAPADVLDPIRALVLRAEWVDDIPRLQAVYVGPSRLLVNVWVVPTPAASEASAGDLVGRVGDLRSAVLASPHVVQVSVTVDGSGRAWSASV
ncbi:cation diffusion facilitator family transporter [Luedemannella flava]|uniref:Cation diffusion facilitator family transporter n=1 Tax=Luedemannella flava TaxID=349316 RepID=A0ABN2LW70_9ACTN